MAAVMNHTNLEARIYKQMECINPLFCSLLSSLSWTHEELPYSLYPLYEVLHLFNGSSGFHAVSNILPSHVILQEVFICLCHGCCVPVYL